MILPVLGVIEKPETPPASIEAAFAADHPPHAPAAAPGLAATPAE